MKRIFIKFSIIFLVLFLFGSCRNTDRSTQNNRQSELATINGTPAIGSDDYHYYINVENHTFVMPENVDASTFFLRINVATQRVNIWMKDERGAYTIPVKQFIASTGRYETPSPLGTFNLSSRHRWHMFFFSPALGAVTYGQYCVRINGPVLIHSMVYAENHNPASILWEQYNRLGNRASAGCIRVNISASKWIYDNLPRGTRVEIYEGEDDMPRHLLARPLPQLPPGFTFDPDDIEYIKSDRFKNDPDDIAFLKSIGRW